MTDNYQIYISNVAVWSIIIYVFFSLYNNCTTFVLFKKKMCVNFFWFSVPIFMYVVPVCPGLKYSHTAFKSQKMQRRTTRAWERERDTEWKRNESETYFAEEPR